MAKGGLVQISGQVASRAISLLFVAVAVRILGTAEYGVYRQVLQVLMVCSLLGVAGFNEAAVRFISQARAQGSPERARGAAKTALIGTLVTSGIVFVTLLVSADLIAQYLARSEEQQAEIAFLLRLGAIYVPLFASMQTLRFSTHANKTMMPSTMVGAVIQPISRSVLGIVALLLGFELVGAILTLIIATALGGLAALRYYADLFTPLEQRAHPEVQVTKVSRFALTQAGGLLLSAQGLGLGILILGSVQNDRAVGLFALALSLQALGAILLYAVFNISSPVIAELHERGDLHRLSVVYQSITRWSAMASFPIFVALMLEGDVFVGILAGDKAAGATAVVGILACGNIVSKGCGPSGPLLSMSGRPGLYLVDSLIAVLSYIVLGLWAATNYGLIGMAIVDACVTATIQIVQVLQVRFVVGVHPFGRSFLKPLGATAIFAGVLLLWRLVPGRDLLMGMAGLALAAVAYVVAIRFFGIDPEDREILDRMKSRGGALRRKLTRSRRNGSQAR